MFGKKTIIISLIIFVALAGYSSMYLPNNIIGYSKNETYKVVASPYYCSEDTCHDPFDCIDKISLPLDSNLKKQQLFIYKKEKSKYIKIKEITNLSTELFFTTSSQVKITNDGRVILFFTTDFNISGLLIKIHDNGTIETIPFDLFLDFDLSPDECAYSIQELSKNNSKTKISYSFNNKYFAISMYYYNEKANKYIKKRLSFNLYP